MAKKKHIILNLPAYWPVFVNTANVSYDHAICGKNKLEAAISPNSGKPLLKTMKLDLDDELLGNIRWRFVFNNFSVFLGLRHPPPFILGYMHVSITFATVTSQHISIYIPKAAAADIPKEAPCAPGYRIVPKTLTDAMVGWPICRFYGGGSGNYI